MRRAIFFLLLANHVAAANEIAGRWEGALKIPGQEFNLIVDLDRPDGKTWVGSIIIPGLGVKGTPLADLTIDGAQISFTLKGTLTNQRVGPAKFEGRLGRSGELSGNFLQAGNIAPFSLRKTGSPQVELPRQSTAIGRDFEGEWKGDYEMTGYPRHVTLTLANRASGGASVQFVIVGKKTNNVPVDLVMEEGGLLTIESPEFGVSYEGRLGKETGEIKGTFTLGPFELPLVLKRTP